MSVVLVGFKGAGKSTIGPLLAGRLGCAFDDLDQRVEEGASRRLGEAVSAREAFRRMGEEAFRALERELLERALEEKDLVLSLGGGTPLLPGVPGALKAHCVVYVRVPEADLLRRIRAGGWPAYVEGAPDPEAALRRLLAERLPRYEELADVIVDNPEGADPAGAAAAAAEEVRRRMRVPR